MSGRKPDGASTSAVVDDATRTRSMRELFTSRHAALAVGVLLLEFSTGASVYASAVVVPSVIADLDAAGSYPLILSATAVGLFSSLALATRSLGRFGPRAVLAAGLTMTLAGALASALAPDPWVFAVGRLVAALGSGLLGVFGTSAVIATVPDGYRIRLLAMTSAMWIVPGLLGPSLAVLALNAVGWRITLLLVLPLILLARLLLGRAALEAMGRQRTGVDPPATLAEPLARRSARRTLLSTLLLPLGMAVFTFGTATAIGAWGLGGLVIAIVGAVSLLPPGTTRAAPGPPRYLALLAVVSFGFFGADALLTTIATRADGIGLAWVSIALGVAAAGWSLASMAQPRLSGGHGERTEAVLRAGTVVMVLAAATIVMLQVTGRITGPLMLAAWAVVGIGMGLAYPTLYLRSTTAAEDGSGGPSGIATAAAALATAVLVAESVGSVIGTATGSAVVDVAQRLGFTEANGLHAAMVTFVGALAGAAALALLGGRRQGGSGAAESVRG